MTLEGILGSIAKIKSYIGLIFFIIIFIFIIINAVNTSKAHYVKSPKPGNIFTGEMTEQGVVEPCFTCATYYLTYVDKTREYTVLLDIKPPKIGSVTVYYSSKDPTQYLITDVQPKTTSTIFIVIGVIVLIGIVVNIYLITKYKTLATVEGGLDVFSMLTNR